MKSPNTKNSEQLEKEVHGQIRKVNRDLNELRGRLSPGQMIDSAIFSQDQSLRDSYDHLRQNPVGTAFLSLGTLMLMQDESHQSFEGIAKDKMSSTREKFSEKVAHLKDEARAKVGDIKANLEDIKAKKIESESDFENWRSSKDDFGIRERAKESFHSAKDKISSRISDGRASVKALDPLSFAALGVGLGAVTGAALPLNDKESEFVGSHLQNRLNTFDSELREALNECSNILKDLVVNDVKDFKLKVL